MGGNVDIFLEYNPLPMLYLYLLPTGSKERGVFGFDRIPVEIVFSGQDMKTVAL